MAPFDRSHTTYYLRHCKYMTLNNIVTLKSGLEVTQGHWKWYHSKASVQFPIHISKRSIYRAANAIFGKIGRFASEEVTLHLLKTKCIPVLLYGLEALPLNKSHISSIDFVINRFFMKLFNTNNIEIVKCCQQEFCFSLPSITLAHRNEFFLGKIRQCDNLLVKRLLCM